MIEHIDSILTFMVLFIAALISPGPVFALIVKNSLVYSRKSAILTALGIALGAIVHTSYILFGIGELLLRNECAFTTFTYIGASYLVYIGIKGITSKVKIDNLETLSHKADISVSRAVVSGFFTCVFNPKAILFLTSMFTVIIKPNTPIFLMVIYGVIIFLETFMWYCIVSIFLSTPAIRLRVNSIEHWINRLTGGILIAIGLKLVL